VRSSSPTNALDGVEKYRVVDHLGGGGMGEVYVAEHALLGHRVVVKVLHAELARHPHLVDRMRLEAQVLAQLRHPNLVRVVDFDETPLGRPYLVMEHLRGATLAAYLDSRGAPLDLADALDLAVQALDGLGHAHERGLVHRDVKPENLFVCTTEMPRVRPLLKVLDFGVAKVLDGGSDGFVPLALPTAAGVVVGTPRFFAPEQARGMPLDARADLYAFGLCLYTMLAGRGPFDDCMSLIELARAHLFEAPAAPSALAARPLPSGLDALVLACLEKRSADRPASARQVADELRMLARSLD
jgi:serine/threonine-protein kinase